MACYKPFLFSLSLIFYCFNWANYYFKRTYVYVYKCLTAMSWADSYSFIFKLIFSCMFYLFIMISSCDNFSICLRSSSCNSNIFLLSFFREISVFSCFTYLLIMYSNFYFYIWSRAIYRYFVSLNNRSYLLLISSLIRICSSSISFSLRHFLYISF